MKERAFFITGTDTGVGKTLFASLLLRYLKEVGHSAIGLKPICSGGREDAKELHAAAGGALPLDQVNPWHFRAALAPWLAARQEKRVLKLSQVTAGVRRVQKFFKVLVIEGAGGLLSPLGEKFNSRDIIRVLRATPIVICPNRLGAVNQALLVLAALPTSVASKTHVVLMSPSRAGAVSRSNPQLLGELIGEGRVHVLPWLGHPARLDRALANQRVRAVLAKLVG